MKLEKIINLSGTTPTFKPLEKSALYQEKRTLCASIQEVKNTRSAIDEEIKATNDDIKKNQSLLASLRAISSRHGSDVNIRFKNDHFKFEQGSNFLKNIIHGGRYKLEQQAAANKLGVKGSEVSVGTGILTLTQASGTIKESLDSSTSKLNNNQIKFDKLTAKLEVVKKQIKTINGAEAAMEKAAAKDKEFRQNFSLVYQSNAGCKAINAEARYQFGTASKPVKLNGNKVIAEYKNVHGNNIFERGNKGIDITIKTRCDDVFGLVKHAAKAWYTPTDNSTTSHRGQGMTQNGVDKLITQFNNDRAGSVYKLGQFFSTSIDKSVAESFADKTEDSVKVMFEVKGNSGRKIVVSGGLKFENNEREVLYSPLANFKVTDIQKDNSGGYKIKLSEVKLDEQSKPKLLPY